MTHTIGQNIVDGLLLCASLFQIAFMIGMIKYSSLALNIKYCCIPSDFFLSGSAIILWHFVFGSMSVYALVMSIWPMREYVMLINLIGLLLFYAEFIRLRNRRQLANDYQNILQNIQDILIG
uniref:Uncharacterized protein n=1 Tax=Marseillevirus LCMAC102 TaxID=2506603 RepID=A0A481YSN5_9VIRU|nr:MAG: hypothetical protein LCMAC102_00880 [Marseillevirus LCMAC102]